MTDYTKTTDFTSKDSLPSGDSGKIIRGAEFGTEFDNIETAVNSKSNIENPSFTGNITVTGTVDGRDIAADGTKLDTVETSADVTDTANVTAAGAVMDSELTNITAVKALNQGVATTDSPTFAAVTSTGNVTVGGTVDGRDVAADGTKLDGIEAGATADQTPAQIKTAYESNANTNAFTDADHTKLDGIEASADVTDATNVTAAGALMDSEVTNLAQVKAFDSADYATAAQGTTADNALPKTGGAMTGAITTNSTFDGRDVATDGTKLDGIEALADVTDTANVTAAGALMDSELTSIASVKALNQGVATTDSPTFDGLTVDSQDVVLATFQRDGGGSSSSFGGYNIKFTAANSTLGDDYFLGIDLGGQFSLTTDSNFFSPVFTATSTGIDVNGTVEFNGLSGTGAVTVTDILDQDNMSSNSATALATQQSIKSYVDSQVATSDTLAEVLANGNATGGTDVAFGTNDKALFGAGSDLQIYHTGSQNYIEDAGTGNLNFKSNGNNFNFLDGSDNVVMQIDIDSETTLYHNTSAKLATTSTGIDVTGTVTADSLTVNDAGTIQLTKNTTSAGDSLGIIEFHDEDGSASADAGKFQLQAFRGTDKDSPEFKLIGSNSSGVLQPLLVVNSTGIDVTGTVTADGLTVNGTTDSTEEIARFGNNAGTQELIIEQQGSTGYAIKSSTDLRFHADYDNDTSDGGSNIEMYTDGIQRMSITGSTGDISFYEDTGTTAKFFWDSSAESLGIGTAPDAATVLHVQATEPQVLISDASSPLQRFMAFDVGLAADEDTHFITVDQADALAFGEKLNGNDRVIENEWMRITNAGNVGIGTDSPATKLMLEHNNDGAVGGTIRIKDRDSQQGANQLTGAIEFESEDATTPTSGVSTAIKAFAASSTGGSYLTISTTDIGTSTLDEAMRIDSSQNLLVGTTLNDGQSIGASSQDGIVLAGESQYIQRSDNANLWLSKPSGATSDEYIKFYANSTLVGSIGTELDRLFIGSDDSMIFFDAGSTNAIWPWTSTATSSGDADNTIDIGDSDNRFKDLYLSGGVVFGTTGGNVTGATLDDYEEGTWTPTINSGTISATEATYTKIGNVVTLRANIGDISDNTTATDINISGLPFTASSTNRAVGSSMFRYFSKTNMAQVTPYVGQSRTFIEFYVSFNSNSTWTPLQFDDGAQANMDLIFSITYIA